MKRFLRPTSQFLTAAAFTSIAIEVGPLGAQVETELTVEASSNISSENVEPIQEVADGKVPETIAPPEVTLAPMPSIKQKAESHSLVPASEAAETIAPPTEPISVPSEILEGSQLESTAELLVRDRTLDQGSDQAKTLAVTGHSSELISDLGVTADQSPAELGQSAKEQKIDAVKRIAKASGPSPEIFNARQETDSLEEPLQTVPENADLMMGNTASNPEKRILKRAQTELGSGLAEAEVETWTLTSEGEWLVPAMLSKPAKETRLQENLRIAALKYAQDGDFDRARLIATDPMLTSDQQSMILAQILGLESGNHHAGQLISRKAILIEEQEPSALKTASLSRSLQFEIVAPEVMWLSPRTISRVCQANPSEITEAEAVTAPVANSKSAIAPASTSKPKSTLEVVRYPSIQAKTFELSHQPVIQHHQQLPKTLLDADRIPISYDLTAATESVKPKARLLMQAIEPKVSPKLAVLTVINTHLLSTLSAWGEIELTEPQTETQITIVESKPTALSTNRQDARPTAIASLNSPCSLAFTPGAVPLRSLGKMAFPLSIPAQITSLFGWRVHPISRTHRFHAGTDFGAPMGTPVLAAWPGRVAIAEAMDGYGFTVILEHPDLRQQTLYAHLSTIAVEPGTWVESGTLIGQVGSTGYSTGPHLHFEVRQATSSGWVAVNPLVANSAP